MKRIIWFDLDGTLYGSSGAHPGIKELKLLKKKGFEFGIASARAPWGIKPVEEHIGPVKYFTAFQGALVRIETIGETQEYGFPMNNETVCQIIQICEEQNCNAWIYTYDKWYILRNDEWVRREAGIVERQPDETWKNIMEDEVFKILVVNDASSEMIEIINQKLNELPVRSVRSHPEYLEIISERIDLDKSVRFANNIINVEESYAVGDGQNDAEMLKNALLSFSFINANPLAKKAASILVQPASEGGLIEIVEYLQHSC